MLEKELYVSVSCVAKCRGGLSVGGRRRTEISRRGRSRYCLNHNDGSYVSGWCGGDDVSVGDDSSPRYRYLDTGYWSVTVWHRTEFLCYSLNQKGDTSHGNTCRDAEPLCADHIVRWVAVSHRCCDRSGRDRYAIDQEKYRLHVWLV